MTLTSEFFILDVHNIHNYKPKKYVNLYCTSLNKIVTSCKVMLMGITIIYFRVAYKLMPETVEFYEALGLTIGDRLNYVKNGSQWTVQRIAA